MESLGKHRESSPVGSIVIIVIFASIVAVALLAIFRPDRGASLFDRAQRLEAAGQWKQALGHYKLLSDTLPDSAFAPRALMQEASILEATARRSGKSTFYRQAIDIYQKIPYRYPKDTLAGQALLNAADLASSDLQDYMLASNLYQRTLRTFPRNDDYASQATLALGNIALVQRNAKLAQKYFARILDRYKKFPERCAEAQYQTGIVAETLNHRPESAKAAYQLVIDNYPNTIWANNAKTRLGMLFYGDISAEGPARRVITNISPLPDAGYSEQFPIALVLAARGVNVNATVLQGWSLQPFYAGFDEQNPGKIVGITSAFSNIVANSGLRFSVRSAADNEGANDDGMESFAALRGAVDRGETPVVYIGKWFLIVGYDTVSQIVFLQERGAQLESMPIEDFLEQWGKSKPQRPISSSSAYTMMSFQSGKNQPKTASSKLNPQPRQGPQLSGTPAFELIPAALSTKEIDRRAVRQAAALLNQTRSDNALLNVEALRRLITQFESLSAPIVSPVPVPENTQETGERADENEEDGENAERNEPTVEPFLDWQQRRDKLRNLAPWFNKPLQQWIDNRRAAAAYLESASRTLGNKQIGEAATEIRRSVSSLQKAADNFPPIPETGSAANWTRNVQPQLQQITKNLQDAKNAEQRAAKLIQDAA